MSQFGKLLGTLIRHKLHYERWTLFSSKLGSIAYAEVSRDFWNFLVYVERDFNAESSHNEVTNKMYSMAVML